MTATILAETAEIVRDVDNECRIVFAAQGLKLEELRRIRVHGEQAFGDHQNAVFFVLGADLGEHVATVIVVEMPEQMNIVGCGVRAFLKTGMREHVHDHMVRGPDKSLHNAESCPPSRGIQDDMVHVDKFGNLAFKRKRMRCIADEGRRTRTVNAAALDRLDCGSLDFGV